MEAPHHTAAPISIRTTASRTFVKPDLNVFFELFTAAASAQHYRRAVYLRLNPTLTEVGDGEYAYAHHHEGAWVMARFSDEGTIPRLRRVLQDSEHADFVE
jgi:hypothetical protein